MIGQWVGKWAGNWLGQQDELPEGFASGVASFSIGATGSIDGVNVSSPVENIIYGGSLAIAHSLINEIKEKINPKKKRRSDEFAMLAL